MNKAQKIILVLLILGGVGYYYYSTKKEEEENNENDNVNNNQNNTSLPTTNKDINNNINDKNNNKPKLITTDEEFRDLLYNDFSKQITREKGYYESRIDKNFNLDRFADYLIGLWDWDMAFDVITIYNINVIDKTKIIRK